jgi:M6 family metalloprotease-like protein
MPAPFAGQHFTFYNPDGSEIQVIGWGNQFQAVFETPDGYTVIKDPGTGYYHYAQLSDDQSTLLPTAGRVGVADPETLGIPKHIRITGAAAKANAAAARDARAAKPLWEVRREQRRARLRRQAEGGSDEEPHAAAEPPLTGNLAGLCLLIAFPDVPAAISQQEISNFCNQHGYTGYGNNGSVCDYFLGVSGGKLNYTNVVTAYHTSAHNRAYYTDPKIENGVRAQELVAEALTALQAGGFDFNQISSNPNGYVYALNVLYAGDCVNNWAEGLWPHSGALAEPFVAGASKTFFDYQITDIGSQLTLRTFCHENGHMVCTFPDLYDYGYESLGVGDYCLMGYGASENNPAEVCAYLKYEAGWASAATTLAPGMSASVRAGVNEFLLHKKDDIEYFILENRQQTGRDASLPDAGLAIWHVDRFGSNNLEQMTPSQHYECSLEQADNRFDLERNFNTGDADDLFGAPGEMLFSNATAPNSKWWDGIASGLEIENISAPGPTMTVTIHRVEVPPQPGATLGLAAEETERLDMYYTGTGRQVWVVHLSPMGENIPAGLGGTLKGGPAAASATTPIQQPVFGRGTDDQLWWKATQTSAWKPLGGRLTSKPSAVFDAVHQELWVVVRGTDGAVWYRVGHVTPAGAVTWDPWRTLGGRVLQGTAPTVTVSASYGVVAAAVGTDHAVWVNYPSASGARTWRSIGGRASADPALAAPSATTVVAFVCGTDHAAWYMEFLGHTAGVTAGWHSLGGRLTSGVTALTATQGPAFGDTSVFALGTDNRAWSNRGKWPALTGWQRVRVG